MMGSDRMFMVAHDSATLKALEYGKATLKALEYGKQRGQQQHSACLAWAPWTTGSGVFFVLDIVTLSVI